jgi:hypothetical protein
MERGPPWTEERRRRPPGPSKRRETPHLDESLDGPEIALYKPGMWDSCPRLVSGMIWASDLCTERGGPYAGRE